MVQKIKEQLVLKLVTVELPAPRGNPAPWLYIPFSFLGELTTLYAMGLTVKSASFVSHSKKVNTAIIGRVTRNFVEPLSTTGNRFCRLSNELLSKLAFIDSTIM